MIKYIFTSLFLILTLVSPIRAEDTQTGIFNPNFHTLQVNVEGNELSPPIITLNSDDIITISFDEIAEDRRYMRYSLVHCDAQWRPSGLVDSEFVDGFNLGDVENYEFSQATITHYVHYKISLPNEQVRFTISGNYLLKVFDENNTDDTLLQVRFMINENTAKLRGNVTSRTDIDYNDKHQQLEFEVDAEKANIQDMYNDIKVVITQDGRTDNEIILYKPLRIAGKTAYFQHLPQLIFPAGNEYRRFETVSVTYPGMGVDNIVYADPLYHMELHVDKPRSETSYIYDQTQFGRYKIREYNSVESDTEADYVIVHFTLASPEISGVDMFIEGDITNRRFDPESRMIYNNAIEAYEKSLLLKQGAYNYQYLAVPFGSTKGFASAIEGDYYPTIHEYTIKVYHRKPGARYDKLIGATTLYSGR